MGKISVMTFRLPGRGLVSGCLPRLLVSSSPNYHISLTTHSETVQAPFQRKSKALTDAVNCNHQRITIPQTNYCKKKYMYRGGAGSQSPNCSTQRHSCGEALDPEHIPLLSFMLPSSSLCSYESYGLLFTS